MDKLLVNLASVEEVEEGYTAHIQLDNDNLSVSSTASVPNAIYDPLSNMYISNPVPIQDTRTDALVAADWDYWASSHIVMDLPEAGKGIQVTSPASSPAWWIESLDYDRWEQGRGYYIDFNVFAPTDLDYAGKPISFYFGSFSTQSFEDETDIYKYRLDIFGNENGAGTAIIYEYNRDYTGKQNEQQWFNLGSFQLVSSDFYNNNHRIWIQPITQKRFIIKNVTSGAGIVVIQKNESKMEVPVPEEQGGGSAETTFVWADSKFRVEGHSIGYFILRDVEYPTSFTIYAKDYSDVGYTSTQDFEERLRWYAPDSLGSSTAWTSTFNIYNEDEVNWQGTGGRLYIWDWTIEAPADGTEAGRTLRAATVSSITLKLSRVTQSNGLLSTDLFASSLFCVQYLIESRSIDDSQSTLNFKVTGASADWNTLGWPQENGRVQWQIDTGSGYYVRFDGFVDNINGGAFVDFSDDTYHVEYDITVKSRWRDAEYAVFTGCYALDNMTRSAVYTLLAEQMGLDTSTELSIAADLVHNEALPQSELGQKPSMKTKIGENVLDIFKDLQKYFSVDDKLAFRDNGSGTVVLYITNQNNTNKGTIYRSDSTQSTPLVIASGGGDNKPQKISANDKSFFNDIFVIGGDIEGAQGTGNIFMANYRYPPSWQNTADPLYIRKRRILIAISPAWNTQGLVNVVGYGLFKKYVKFDIGEVIDAFLQYNIYPGDILTLDAGGTGESDRTVKIKAMRTSLQKLSRPLTRRYSCQYEVEMNPDI